MLSCSYYYNQLVLYLKMHLIDSVQTFQHVFLFLLLRLIDFDYSITEVIFKKSDSSFDLGYIPIKPTIQHRHSIYHADKKLPNYL